MYKRITMQRGKVSDPIIMQRMEMQVVMFSITATKNYHNPPVHSSVKVGYRRPDDVWKLIHFHNPKVQ
jgi:hypothetical protein